MITSKWYLLNHNPSHGTLYFAYATFENKTTLFNNSKDHLNNKIDKLYAAIEPEQGLIWLDPFTLGLGSREHCTVRKKSVRCSSAWCPYR